MAYIPLKTTAPDLLLDVSPDPITWNLALARQRLRLLEDQKEQILCYPAFLFDNLTGLAFNYNNPLPVSATFPGEPAVITDRGSVITLLDNGNYAIGSTSTPESGNALFVNEQIKNIGNNAVDFSAAGDTAITSAGTNPSIKGMTITLPIGTTTAAALTLTVQTTAGAVIWVIHVSAAALIALTQPVTFEVMYPSTYAFLTGNDIKITLSTALTAGVGRINVWTVTS